MTEPFGDRPDADLVVAARAGDAGAYQELFTRHVDHVTAICRQRLCTPADVDDAVQETFARALGNLRQLRDDANFGAWARTIAVRVCTDHHRATTRSFAAPVEELDLTDGAPQPDELVLAAEHSQSVRRSLAQLGPRDAQALWLRHVTDAPVSTVADELGLTPGSTRVLLTRARHRLRAATTALPALVPLSWRQWWRNQLPAAGPVLETMVAVMALGLVVNALGAPPAAEAESARTADEHAMVATTPAIDSDRPAAPQRMTLKARGERGSGRAGTRTARTRDAAATPAGPSLKVTDTVTVQKGYPDDGEADSLADVALHGDGEEIETRLYGGAPKPVKQARRALPRVPDGEVAVGGVRIGKGDDRGDGR